MKHFKYLRYVLIHKWHVLWECCRLGILWRGIVHDLSKFKPSEWKPYADFFYGTYRAESEIPGFAECEYGEISKEQVSALFDKAWNHHQKRNPHHWQYWELHEDDGGCKRLPMPDKYRKEMIADWIGAGIAITGKREVAEWYKTNYDKIRIHSETRKWIDGKLGVTTDK